MDASAQIAGSCLEQTTWLRRNLEVNTQLLQGEAENDEKALSSLPPSMPLAPILAPVAPELLHVSDAALAAQRPPSSRSSSSSASISEEKRAMTAFSVPALALLGELLAPLLDIIYHSDEKEKVVPLLYSVMDYVVPYLRNHSRANLPSYRACSKLLAALSEYQYTRRAWKKDGMELLLDVAFFQTDLASLAHWRVTVDNLMTHDKTTFKELMSEWARSRQLCPILTKSVSRSQNFRHLAIVFAEPVLLKGTRDGAEGIVAEAARICHILLRRRPISKTDARHTR